jgi:tRNA(Ile)-lysidine synthase
MTLLAKIKANLAEHGGLLQEGDSVLIALSGGVDSVCLAAILHKLSSNHDWRLHIAHLNHQLRGPHSDEDEAFVRGFAEQLALPFSSERTDVKAFAHSEGISIEMAARKLRHRFLAREAERLGIKKVALAHHADDQIELFFLRVLRGRAGAGLGGMRWSAASPENKSITLIRPLLNIRKPELTAYAVQANLGFREDASNVETTFERNKIRQTLLPFLRSEFADFQEENLLRIMSVLSAEKDLCHSAAEKWLLHRRLAFKDLPVAVQREAIHLQLLSVNLVPDFHLIEHLREHPNHPLTIGPNQFVESNNEGEVAVHTSHPNSFLNESAAVDLSAVTCFTFANCTFQIAFESAHAAHSQPYCEYFDADKIGTQITLRHWQPGDRLQPIGMSHSVKLQDLFTNAKIDTSHRRACIVAVAQSGEIFWVERLRIAEKFKVTPQTKSVLKWTWGN